MKRIDTTHTIAKHAHLAAVLFAAIFTLTGLAHADSMYSAHSHKGKKGTLKITAPTEVGGTTLEPGDYLVREANSPDGPVVEFVHEYQNYANDIVTEEEEVVARVRYTEHALSSPPKHTELQRAPDTSNVVALEIRGNPVDHVFQSENMEQGYASK